MKVCDAMTTQVVTANPDTPIKDVAARMSEADIGSVPVVSDGKVIGLVTDRDIIVRVVATHGDLAGPVSEIMSNDIQGIDADASLADASAKMGAHQVRRLIVYGEGGKLSGILSLGDIAMDYGDKVVGHTLEEISAEPANN